MVNHASLVIEGSGALKATSAPITDVSSTYSSAIMVTGDLTIEGGTITAIGSEAYAASCGINVENGNIYITGGTVYTNCALEDGSIVAKGGEVTSGFGVGAEGDISITGGDINATGGTASNLSHGVGAEGNISISGGELNANTGAAPYAFGIGTKKRLSYQWKVNKNDGNGWTDISGATQTSYTTQTVDKGWDGFQYKCVVSNSVGSVESEG